MHEQRRDSVWLVVEQLLELSKQIGAEWNILTFLHLLPLFQVVWCVHSLSDRPRNQTHSGLRACGSGPDHLPREGAWPGSATGDHQGKHRRCPPSLKFPKPCLNFKDRDWLIFCGLNIAWPQPCLYGTEWVLLAGDIEESMRFPPTSEVLERFEGQHMWQMGSKLEAPWLLLGFSIFTLLSLSPSLHCITDGGQEKMCEKLDFKILPLFLKSNLYTPENFWICDFSLDLGSPGNWYDQCEKHECC